MAFPLKNYEQQLSEQTLVWDEEEALVMDQLHGSVLN